MVSEFSPITLGQPLGTFNAAGFILTETTHLPNHTLPRHSHERANIAFVVNGSFSETLDFRSIECNPQSLVIKPAGEAHANRYGSRGMRCLLIELEPERLEGLHSWSKVFEQPSHVHHETISMLAMRLYGEFRFMDEASPVAIEGLMLELIAELSRHDKSPADRKRPRWLEQAKEILHAHFCEGPGVSRVAKEVSIHPVHLAREFRKHFGCSVGEYVLRLRIESACRELANSDSPLVEIALAAGFAHQAHFSRVFKRETGVTPSAFRSALRSR